jgi:hypothetical protein
LTSTNIPIIQTPVQAYSLITISYHQLFFLILLILIKRYKTLFQTVSLPHGN